MEYNRDLFLKDERILWEQSEHKDLLASNYSFLRKVSIAIIAVESFFTFLLIMTILDSFDLEGIAIGIILMGIAACMSSFCIIGSIQSNKNIIEKSAKIDEDPRNYFQFYILTNKRVISKEFYNFDLSVPRKAKASRRYDKITINYETIDHIMVSGQNLKSKNPNYYIYIESFVKNEFRRLANLSLRISHDIYEKILQIFKSYINFEIIEEEKKSSSMSADLYRSKDQKIASDITITEDYGGDYYSLED